MKQEEADWPHTGRWKKNPKNVIEMGGIPYSPAWLFDVAC